MTNSTLSLTYI